MRMLRELLLLDPNLKPNLDSNLKPGGEIGVR